MRPDKRYRRAERFAIFGHRGSPKRHPENTLASFDEALRAGADGFETDLRLLSDGTAVLFHDDEIDGIEVETLTAAQVEERGGVAERVSALSRYAGRAQMILEVKRAGWEDALIAQISAWPGIVVASFDHSLLLSLHERGVPFPLGITFHGSLVDVGAYAEKLGATWCFPNHRFVDEAMVRALHERGILIVPWTVNQPHEWQRLDDAGCDGMMTDLPHDAVVWRGAMEAED